MKNFLIISFAFFSTISFGQKMPTLKVKDSKSKGKAIIYYRLKESFHYIKNTELIDWRNSLEKLEVSEIFNKEKKYYQENCQFVDGKKNGEFSISEVTLKKLESSYGDVYFLGNGQQILSGNYKNDEYEGKIKMLNIRKDNKDLYLEINYSKNIISDQVIELPEVKRVFGAYETRNLNFIPEPIVFNPSYEFTGGVVSKSIILDDKDSNLPTVFEYKNDETHILRYTYLPFCFESGMPYSANSFGIEKFTLNLDSGTKKQYLHGQYKLFLPNFQIFDTSQLIATFDYVKGRKEGVAKIWDVNKMKQVSKQPIEISNYKSGLLHGECKTFYPDGKIAIEAKFEMGLPIGEAVSYYNISQERFYKVYSFNNIVPNWEKTINGWKLIGDSRIQTMNHPSLGIWDDSDIEAIELIKEKGGKISNLNGYGIFCKINYKLDSISDNGKSFIKISNCSNDFSIFNNGKPMMTFINLKNQNKERFKEILWQDETGKIVYSASQRQKEDNEKTQKKLEEIEKQNNINIICKWCNKKFRFGDRIEIDECPCFNRDTGNSSGIVLWVPLGFCSNECRVNYEKDCCRKNGLSHEKY